jgi:hypothetical protein
LLNPQVQCSDSKCTNALDVCRRHNLEVLQAVSGSADFCTGISFSGQARLEDAHSGQVANTTHSFVSLPS